MRVTSRSIVRLAVGSLLLAAVWGAPAAALAQDEPPVEEPVEEPAPNPEEPDPAEPSAEPELVRQAVQVLVDTRPALDLAFERLAADDWDGCITPFTEVAEALEPHPLLGGLRDQCLYNMACALARSDRPAEAVAAFAAALEHGLRPVATPVEGGRVVLGPGLSFAHILIDSDLDSLREREDFRTVLDGLLRAGEPVVELSAAAAALPEAAGLPGVVVALPEDRDVETGATPWREALADVPAVLVFVAGPVRPVPSARRWVLVDGDDRFAIEKIGAGLDALLAHPAVDPARTYLTALSGPAGQAALAVALERPQELSGMALGPFRFHAAFHADAIHALATARGTAAPWRVSVIAPSERLVELFAAAGVEVDALDAPPPIVTAQARGDVLRDTTLSALRRLLE